MRRSVKPSVNHEITLFLTDVVECIEYKSDRNSQAGERHWSCKPTLRFRYYSNILCGVIAGAMEQLRINVAIELIG